jgi:outer membrane biosynthesis protein TonB
MTEENSESNWFQDNLRIIISVGIVILLVFAIYSYSKRNSRTDVVVDDSQIEEVAMTADSENNKEINEILDEIKDEEQATTEEITTEQPQEPTKEEEQAAKVALEQKIADQQHAEQETQEKQQVQEEAEKTAQEEAQTETEKTAQEEANQEEIQAEQKTQEETENIEEQEAQKQAAKDAMREVIESHSTQTRQKDGVIVVVAIKGDSTTTLARKAAADYINTNNVGGLTPAHRIYIEDYMRKATSAQSIHPGTEIAFSNDLISNAIESSRTLTDAQLQNLDKYAQNVSTF